jgi:hypoxanthine phosphoribosyltransferase
MNDERENLSWQRFGEASRELAKIIAADGFQPDLILSIARGGLFLAGSLGYALAVKNLYVMNVEFLSPTTSPIRAGPSSSCTPSSRTRWTTCVRR